MNLGVKHEIVTPHPANQRNRYHGDKARQEREWQHERDHAIFGVDAVSPRTEDGKERPKPSPAPSLSPSPRPMPREPPNGGSPCLHGTSSPGGERSRSPRSGTPSNMRPRSGSPTSDMLGKRVGAEDFFSSDRTIQSAATAASGRGGSGASSSSPAQEQPASSSSAATARSGAGVTAARQEPAEPASSFYASPRTVPHHWGRNSPPRGKVPLVARVPNVLFEFGTKPEKDNPEGKSFDANKARSAGAQSPRETGQTGSACMTVPLPIPHGGGQAHVPEVQGMAACLQSSRVMPFPLSPALPNKSPDEVVGATATEVGTSGPSSLHQHGQGARVLISANTTGESFRSRTKTDAGATSTQRRSSPNSAGGTGSRSRSPRSAPAFERIEEYFKTVVGDYGTSAYGKPTSCTGHQHKHNRDLHRSGSDADVEFPRARSDCFRLEPMLNANDAAAPPTGQLMSTSAANKFKSVVVTTGLAAPGPGGGVEAPSGADPSQPLLPATTSGRLFGNQMTSRRHHVSGQHHLHGAPSSHGHAGNSTTSKLNLQSLSPSRNVPVRAVKLACISGVSNVNDKRTPTTNLPPQDNASRFVREKWQLPPRRSLEPHQITQRFESALAAENASLELFRHQEAKKLKAEREREAKKQKDRVNAKVSFQRVLEQREREEEKQRLAFEKQRQEKKELLARANSEVEQDMLHAGDHLRGRRAGGMDPKKILEDALEFVDNECYRCFDARSTGGGLSPKNKTKTNTNGKLAQSSREKMQPSGAVNSSIAEVEGHGEQGQAGMAASSEHDLQPSKKKMRALNKSVSFAMEDVEEISRRGDLTTGEISSEDQDRLFIHHSEFGLDDGESTEQDLAASSLAQEMFGASASNWQTVELDAKDGFGPVPVGGEFDDFFNGRAPGRAFPDEFQFNDEFGFFPPPPGGDADGPPQQDENNSLDLDSSSSAGAVGTPLSSDRGRPGSRTDQRSGPRRRTQTETPQDTSNNNLSVVDRLVAKAYRKAQGLATPADKDKAANALHVKGRLVEGLVEAGEVTRVQDHYVVFQQPSLRRAANHVAALQLHQRGSGGAPHVKNDQDPTLQLAQPASLQGNVKVAAGAAPPTFKNAATAELIHGPHEPTLKQRLNLTTNESFLGEIQRAPVNPYSSRSRTTWNRVEWPPMGHRGARGPALPPVFGRDPMFLHPCARDEAGTLAHSREAVGFMDDIAVARRDTHVHPNNQLLHPARRAALMSAPQSVAHVTKYGSILPEFATGEQIRYMTKRPPYLRMSEMTAAGAGSTWSEDRIDRLSITWSPGDFPQIFYPGETETPEEPHQTQQSVDEDVAGSLFDYDFVNNQAGVLFADACTTMAVSKFFNPTAAALKQTPGGGLKLSQKTIEEQRAERTPPSRISQLHFYPEEAEEEHFGGDVETTDAQEVDEAAQKQSSTCCVLQKNLNLFYHGEPDGREMNKTRSQHNRVHAEHSRASAGMEAPANKMSTTSVHFENSLLRSFLHPNHLTRNLPLKSFRNLKPEVVFDHYGLRPDSTLSAISEVAMTNRGARKLHLEHRRDATAAMKKVLHPFPVLRLSELKRRDEALRRRELNEFDLTKELLQNAGPDGGSIPMEAIPLGALVGATAHMREVERQRREEEEAEEEARRARAAEELGVEMDGLEMEGTKDREEDADGAPGRTDDPIPNAFDAAAEDIAAKQAAYKSFKEQARPTRKPLPTKHHPIVSLRPINPKRSHLWHTEPKRDNAKLADAYLPQQGTNPMQTTNSSWRSGGSWSSREGQHSPRIHLASPEMSIAQRSDRGFTPVAQDHDPSLRSLVDEDERSLASVPPFVFPPYADLSDDRRARVLALLQERKMRARARGILARQRAEGNLRELEALAAARRLSLLQGLGYFDSLSADDRAALFKQAQKQLSGEKMQMDIRNEKNKQTAGGANKSKMKGPRERLKTYVKALQIAVQMDPEMVNYKAIDFGKEYFDSKSASDVWWLFPAHSAFAKKFNSHMDRLSKLFLRESAERGGSELFRVGAQRGAPGGAGSSPRSSPSGSGRASPAAAVHPTIYEHESTHGGGSSPSSSRHGGMLLSPTARKTRAQLIEAAQNPNESFDLFKNRASCAELGQTISALIRELSTDDEIELIGPMTLAFPISQVAHKMRFLEKLQALAEHIRLRAKKQKIIDLRILSLLLKLCNTRLILHLDHLTAGTALMRKDAVKVPGEMLRRKATQLVAMALTQTQEQLLKAEQAEEEVLGAMEHWEKAAKAMGLTIPGETTPSMAQIVEEARAAAQLEQEDELGAPDPTLFGAFDEQMLLATPSPTKSKKEELLTGKSPAGRHAVSFIAKSARSGSFSELSRGGSMEFSRGGSIEFANVVEASSPSQTTGSTPKEVAFEDEGRAGSPAQHQGSTAPGSLPPLSLSSPRPPVSSSPKVVKQMKHAHTVQVLPNELRPGSKEQLKEQRQQAALGGTSAAVAGAPHQMRRAKTSVMAISTEEDVAPIDEEKYVRDAAIQNIRFGLEQVASPVTKHKVTPVVVAAAVALKTQEGAVATSSSPSGALTGASSPSVRAAALSRKSSFATGSGGQTSQQQTPSLPASSSPGGYNFKSTALPRTKEGLQTKMSQLQQGEEQDTPLYHPISFLIRKLGLECASSAMKTQDLELLCSDDPEQMGFLDKNPTGVSLTPYMLSLLTELNKEARKLKDMKALHAGGGKKIWKENSANIVADPQMQNFGIGDFRFTMEESSTNALANLSLEVQLKKDFLLADIMDKDWKVKVDEVFALLDTDYSGYVMRSDMQEWYSQALIKQQKEKNLYDGTVTISKQVQAIFDDIDSNGDGLISYDEWVLYFANLVKNGGISQTQLMMELDWFVKAGGHGTVGLFAKPN